MHFDLFATAKLTSYAPRHNASVSSGGEVVRRLQTLSNSAIYGPGVSVLRLLRRPGVFSPGLVVPLPLPRFTSILLIGILLVLFMI
jgi:hypothetical protein